MACLYLPRGLVNRCPEADNSDVEMSIFRVIEPQRPGFLRRLVGGKLPENAFVEIQNLLATHAIKDLSAAQIITILSDHSIPREEAMPGLADFYNTALRYYLRDTALSAEEREELKQFRYVLDLDEATANEVEADFLRTKFRDELKKALDDDHLSDDEKRKLERMADNFSLSEEVRTQIYKEEVHAIVQEAFNRAIEDRRLTAEEEQRLVKMSENLGATWSYDGLAQQEVKRFKLLARIDAGDLPVIQTPVRLQRGEVCHAEFPSSLHEMRTVTKRVNYHGPTGRIRIMKGLSWRYGSVSVNRITSEELRQLDSGVLYITNKRLLFDGKLKSVQTPFKKIIKFTLYKDGIQIEKETGRDQFCLGSGDLELISEVLESALRLHRGT